jgi:YggT family protein
MYIIKIALITFLRLLDSLILVRVLLSFFPTLRDSRIAYFIYQLTEPIMAPCRAVLDKFGLDRGMFDFSPLLAYLVINLVQSLVYSI